MITVKFGFYQENAKNSAMFHHVANHVIFANECKVMTRQEIDELVRQGECKDYYHSQYDEIKESDLAIVADLEVSKLYSQVWNELGHSLQDFAVGYETATKALTGKY